MNRNYEFQFGFDNFGSSGENDVCAEDYRGPYPFSEPETAALRNFLLYRKHTKVVTMPDGSQLEMRDPSTNLTTKEWAEKMELTMAWAAQHGVVIPAPFMDDGRLPPKER